MVSLFKANRLCLCVYVTCVAKTQPYARLIRSLGQSNCENKLITVTWSHWSPGPQALLSASGGLTYLSWTTSVPRSWD